MCRPAPRRPCPSPPCGHWNGPTAGWLRSLAVRPPPVPRRRAVSVLSALGVSADDERRYQQLLPFAGASVRDVGDRCLGVDARRSVPVTLAGLIERGRGQPRRRSAGGAAATGQILSARDHRQAEAAVRVRERLDDLARADPVAGRGRRPDRRRARWRSSRLDGELSAGGNACSCSPTLIEQSRGDLLLCGPTPG